MAVQTMQNEKLSSRMWKHRHFYLYISPFFILFGIFGLFPVLFSLYLSFVEWNGLTEPKWVGLANFAYVLQDKYFWISLWNTLVIGLMYIPPMLIGAFVFAVMLNVTWLKFRGLFRAAFFLPCITPMVVIAIVFQLLYGQETGLLNYLISKVDILIPWAGLEPIPWLGSEKWSKISVAVLLVWRWTGYNMVLMLAGLQGIPKELYEAAKIDGAGTMQRMCHITLPLMRPVFVFCMIMSLIGTVYMFDEVFVLTKGGPGASSTNFGLYLFQTSFGAFDFGRASCMGWMVATVVFLITLFILKFRKPAVE